MKDILISGYYGFKNSGDDALLLAIINDLKKYKEDVTITVLSNSPRETAKIYGVKAVHRMNPFGVIWAIMKSRVLLSGGGTLIQDGTSTKSLIYYLAIITLAHLFGKKIMLYSNGIGPLKEEHHYHVKKVLDNAHIITLREMTSVVELEMIRVKKPEIILTADPAFSLECADFEKKDEILEGYGIKKGEKYICVSVRKWRKMPPDFCESMAKTADDIYEIHGIKTLFLPMQYPADYEISKKIESLMKTPVACIKGYIAIDDMLSIIAGAQICIGMRLHSLIYAVNMGVPVIGIEYDIKVKSFMQYINQEKCLEADKISSNEIVYMASQCIKERDKIREKILKDLLELKKKAQSNAEYAIKLLEDAKREEKKAK